MELCLDFKDVLIEPRYTEIESRSQVNLVRRFKFKYSEFQWEGVPIASANMDSVTTPDVVNVLLQNRMLPITHKTTPLLGAIQSLGLDYNFKDPIHSPIICLDVANGGMLKFLRFVSKMRELHPEKVIIAGNVVTKNETDNLIQAGADVVKVGLGSGQVCTTRKMTGVGIPQFTAIQECSNRASIIGAHIMSDGGCRESGDICKAFAAGADMVMIGSMLVGHAENGTEYYGLASQKAHEKFIGKMPNYKAAEGVHITVPHKGGLQETLNTIMGGLRSCCSYVGAKNLEELAVRANFVRVIP